MDDQFKNIDLVATWARNAASIIERLSLMDKLKKNLCDNHVTKFFKVLFIFSFLE